MFNENTCYQAALRSSYGRRPPTGAAGAGAGGLKVPGTAMMSSRGRMPTAGRCLSFT